MEIFLKRYINRIVSCIMILSLSLALVTGCKKNESTENRVFNVTNIDIPGASESLDSFNMFPIDNGDIFYGTNVLSSANQNIEHFYYLDNNGKIEHNFNLNFFDGKIIDISFNNKGDVYVLLFGSDNEDIEDAEVSVDTESVDVDSQMINDPRTNSKFLEDKLGYSLFNKRYDIELAKKEAEVNKSNSEQEDENSDDSLNDSGDFVDEEGPADELRDAEGEDTGIEGEEAPIQQETVIAVKPECGYLIEVNPVENAEDYGFESSNGYDSSQDEDNNLKTTNYIKILKISSDGTNVTEKNIIDDIDVNNQFKDEIRIDLFSSIVYENDMIYLVSKENILSYDADLRYQNKIAASDMPDELLGEYTFIRNNDGELYIWFFDPNYDIYIGQVDFANAKVINKTKLLDERYYIRMSSGSSMDFSICKNGYLYGYNIGDSQYTKLVDFMASDLSTDYVSGVGSIDNDHFYASYRTIDDGKTKLGFFSKSSQIASAGKKELSLVVVSSNSEIQKAVVNFNKESKDYRIRLIDYNAMYGTDDYWASEAVYEKLNTDIIAGNMPDMIFLDPNMPIQTYINKGLLENLYPYIENDEEYNIEDYNTNILKVMENDGKLYKISPKYTVLTVIAPKSKLDGITQWNITKAQEIYKNSGALAFFAFKDRSEMLNMVMALSGNAYVDFNKGICDFDNDEFKNTLEFIKSFPSKQDYNDALSDKLFNDYDTMFRDGLVLGDIFSFSSASDFLYEVYGKFGKDYQIIGFPVDNGNGSSVAFEFSLAMSSLSDNKEGCWQFLKYFLCDEYQDSITGSGFPIKNSSFDKMKAYALKSPPQYHYVFDGQTYDNDVQYWMGGEQVPLDPLTDEDMKNMMDLINSIECNSTLDNKVMTIISEESEQFFNNKATLNEAINNIQSRVQIYLYESQ